MPELTRLLLVELTRKELEQRADQLARLHDDLEREEAQKKEAQAGFKKRLDHLHQCIHEAARVVREKRELRQVQCCEVKDYARSVIELIRLDTQDVVESRPMGARDRQPDLPIEAEEVKASPDDQINVPLTCSEDHDLETEQKAVNNNLSEALKAALHGLVGAQKRWDALRAKGASDAELKKAISFELGSGAASSPSGGYSTQGGHRPRFWFGNMVRQGRPTLQGLALINTVRILLKIPYQKTETEDAARPAKKSRRKAAKGSALSAP